jgi:methionine salvage enolase-phosphatase E1
VDWISWLQGIALVGLNNLVSLFWKPWASAYAGEKAKNIARKEDLDKILAEVRAVTVATNEIEAKISGELWDRQMHWTQKKDVYGDLVSNVNELMDAYTELYTYVLGSQTEPKLLSQASAKIRAGYEKYYRSCGLARIFASAECNTAIETL